MSYGRHYDRTFEPPPGTVFTPVQARELAALIEADDWQQTASDGRDIVYIGSGETRQMIDTLREYANMKQLEQEAGHLRVQLRGLCIPDTNALACVLMRHGVGTMWFQGQGEQEQVRLLSKWIEESVMPSQRLRDALDRLPPILPGAPFLIEEAIAQLNRLASICEIAEGDRR